MIITTLMARNVYEQDDYYQSGAKKWSGFGLTNWTGSAGPDVILTQSFIIILKACKGNMFVMPLTNTVEKLQLSECGLSNPEL